MPHRLSARRARGGVRPPLAVEPLEDRRAPAVLSNGTVQLGVNPEGHLNAAGGQGPALVGLRYLPTGAEGVAVTGGGPNGLNEGYGVGDAASGVSGFVNLGQSPAANNLSLVQFSATASTAVSVVDVAGTFRVTHEFRTAARTDHLFEVVVTVRNTGTTGLADVRYRRVVDFDPDPGGFREFLTVQGGTAFDLLENTNDGFATADPLGPPSSGAVSPLRSGNFVNSGPDDQGALFDLGLGALGPGEARTFRLYYGAAANLGAALQAVHAVGAEAYALARPSLSGAPNTFVLAFGGVGGFPASVVRHSDARRAEPGGPPVTASAPGVTATLTHAAGAAGPATLFVAAYEANPEAGAVAGLVFYDLRVKNADPADRVVVSFGYPDIGGAEPVLLYYNPAAGAFVEVGGSTRLPGSLAIDRAARVITVVLDVSSTPAVTSLLGTVFTVAVRVPGSVPVPAAAVARSPSFLGSSQLTLALSPSPDAPLAAVRTSLREVAAASAGPPATAARAGMPDSTRLAGGRTEETAPRAAARAGGPWWAPSEQTLMWLWLRLLNAVWAPVVLPVTRAEPAPDGGTSEVSRGAVADEVWADGDTWSPFAAAAAAVAGAGFRAPARRGARGRVTDPATPE